MSHPEIIYIPSRNNASQNSQKWRMLSKSVLNKNTKKCRCTTGISDSIKGPQALARGAEAPI
jgi:hypothetical protein